MALRNGKVLKWSPRTVADTSDSSNSDGGEGPEAGVMAGLINLISDPTTARCLVPRPSSILMSALATIPNAGFISALYVTNNIAYGMVAATIGGTSGHDIPFIFNLITKTFTTITGFTLANTPVNAPSSGDWTPPTMTIVSTKVMVTHPGFTGAASGNYIGWIDISTPASPVWHAGNTSGNSLPGVPVAVANFNNRAYFAIGNMVFFSDSLNPTVMTNATQSVTLGDTSPVVTLSGLPLTSTTVGGTIQCLMAFKNSIMYQITGDFAIAGTLQVSAVPVAVGTFSPLSVTPTPRGLAFIAPDGLRFVDSTGAVSDAVGIDGEGVVLPFINATYPSRTVAAFSQGTLRISAITNYNPVSLFSSGNNTSVEYWLELAKNKWTGPHTFPASLIQAYNKTFVLTPISQPGSIWQSDVLPNAGSVYNGETGSNLSWNYITSLLPETNEMALNSLIEATIGIAPGLSTGTFNISILDQNYHDITPNGPVTITAGTPTTIWGTLIWGAGNWGGGQLGITNYQIPLKQPVVFKQCYVLISGVAAVGQKIENLKLRYQPLGYLTDGIL